MPKRRIYASSLNNVAQCPCFDWKQNDDTQYADRGTAIHEAEENQDHKKLDTFDIIPYEFGLKVLGEKRVDHFGQILPLEAHEQAFWLPGIGNCKIDYRAWSVKKSLVIDWKTGVTPHYADSDLQGKAYALAIFQHCPEVDEVAICFADLDIRRTSEATFLRSQVPQLHEDVYSVYYAALSEDAVATPCELCAKCEHVTACLNAAENAKNALTTVNAPALPDLAQVRQWNPDQQGEFLDRLNMVDKVLKAVKAEIRGNSVEGNTPTGYAMTERQGSRQIQDVRQAVDVFLEMGLPEPVVDSSLKLSLGDLEKAYVEKKRFEVEEQLGKLPRGFIGQAKEEFYDALEERGLISRGSSVTYLKKSSRKKQLT